MPRLRIAAISFLNPAPLLYNFEHAPTAENLASRYDLHYTQPSQCADDLDAGRADIGLIPIAALTPDLAVVPGCTIASISRVRSIQLIVRGALVEVRTIATDSASRSSLAYTQILFNTFLRTTPTFLPPSPADPIAMLREAQAALLIGDAALLALESRHRIEAEVGPCTWYDLAEQWIAHTGLPWVAAVWAVRPQSFTRQTAAQLIEDLTQSRDAGLSNREGLIQEWIHRVALPARTIRVYLTENIHYILDPSCLDAIARFRQEAAAIGILPPLAPLRLLDPEAL